MTDIDGDQQIKCALCDFNARSPGMLEVHKEAEHKNVCNIKYRICSQVCPNQDEMEIHMAEKHTGDIDCGKCKAVFKKEQDVFDHSNDCSEVLQMNICEFCRQEVVSKLALKST